MGDLDAALDEQRAQGQDFSLCLTERRQDIFSWDCCVNLRRP